MSNDHLQAAEASAPPSFDKLRAALRGDADSQPELVALFQQVRNLREADHSLRSLRRSMDLDNMPVIDPVPTHPEALEAMAQPPAPSSELGELVQAYATLRADRAQSELRLAGVEAGMAGLGAQVDRLANLVERMLDKGQP